MTLGETAPVEVLVRLVSGDPEYGIRLHIISAAEDQRLSARDGEFVLRVWCENPDVIRASITNVRSGHVAMLQGSNALQRLASGLDLRVT